MQFFSTVQGDNKGEFNETYDVIDFPENEAYDLPPTSRAKPLEGGYATATLPIRGSFAKRLQLKGSKSQKLPAKHQPGFDFTNLLGFSTEAESLIDSEVLLRYHMILTFGQRNA